MMQLTYLYFTDITKDQKSYDQQINMLKVQLQNKGLSPEVAFRDSVNVTANCHNPRFNSMELDEIDKLNYDRQLQIARELLSAPGSFTYIFLASRLSLQVCRLSAYWKGSPAQGNQYVGKGSGEEQFHSQDGDGQGQCPIHLVE